MKTFPAHIKIPTGYALLRGDKRILKGDLMLEIDFEKNTLNWLEVSDQHWIGKTPWEAAKIVLFKLKPTKTP